MDYFVKGRIWIDTEAQLAALLETQKTIKVVPVKTGKVVRGVYPDQTSQFDFEVRTAQTGQALIYFNELKKLMQDFSIAGTVHWHECNHDEGIGGCSYDGTFTHLGGA